RSPAGYYEYGRENGEQDVDGHGALICYNSIFIKGNGPDIPRAISFYNAAVKISILQKLPSLRIQQDPVHRTIVLCPGFFLPHAARIRESLLPGIQPRLFETGV